MRINTDKTQVSGTNFALTKRTRTRPEKGALGVRVTR
jgi:hypothetical protein